MGRLLEVKEELVRRNRGWSFVSLETILVDLKLGPETLEVPVPKFFREDQQEAIRLREILHERALVSASAAGAAGEGSLVDDDGMRLEEGLTLEGALRIIQVNERGRQGRERAIKLQQKYKKMRNAEERGEKPGVAERLEGMERVHTAISPRARPERAALTLQKSWRGASVRRQVAATRTAELILLGMAPPPPREDEPMARLAEIKETRKKAQRRREAEYKEALVLLEMEVYQNEGPDIREEMVDELRDWYIKHREQTGSFPAFPPEEDKEALEQEAAAGGKGAQGKDAKGKDASKGKGAKGKGAKGNDASSQKGGQKGGQKGKDSKGPQGAEDAKPAKESESHFRKLMASSCQEWSDKWQHRAEPDAWYASQKHDAELIKQAVRPDVELRIREEVNTAIEKELESLKEAFDTKAKKSKKGKGGKKGKKGTSKGTKGKGNNKKGKKGAGGKAAAKGGKKGPKDPTEGKPIETLYKKLVAAGIAKKVEPVHMKDFVGTPQFVGTGTLDTVSEEASSLLPEPSMAQVRQAVTEYCVLPLGSQAVKEHAPLNMTGTNKAGEVAPKSGTPVLLTGAEGTGKRMLVNAVAHECGANLFDLTPSNTQGCYPGKKAYEMVHTALKVAKAMQPSVVWIGQAEAVWTSGGKKSAKGGGEPANRIVKHLTACLHPKKGLPLIEVADRVLIIGTSSRPHACEKAKAFRTFTDFFSKVIPLPLPNGLDRQALWLAVLRKAGIEWPNRDEVQSLARVSDHYSAGSICNAVRRTVTARRLDRLPKKPFSATELIGPLSKEQPVLSSEVEQLRQWCKKVWSRPSAAEAAGGDGSSQNLATANEQKKSGAKKTGGGKEKQRPRKK